MQRDDLLHQAQERLKARSDDYFVKEFNMPKDQVVLVDAVWNLADLRAEAGRGGGDARALARMHAEIWARSYALMVGFHNLTLQIIREAGVPVNDPRVHDYVAALNVISLQYGVLTALDGASRLTWLLVHDEDLDMAGVIGGAAPKHESQFLYDVALSFAGEDRHYARDVASFLRRKEVRVFFDEDEAARLLGKDLEPTLAEIYREKSQLCVVFSSASYVRKPWTLLELDAAQRRQAATRGEYLVRVKLDDASLPGVSETIAFMDGRALTPEQTAAMVIAKLAAFNPAALSLDGRHGMWTSPAEGE